MRKRKEEIKEKSHQYEVIASSCITMYYMTFFG